MLIAGVVVAVGINQDKNKNQSASNSNKEHQASLVEPFPVSERGVVFNVSNKGQPNFAKLVFDPLESEPGETQKMRLGIKNDTPLKTVKAEITCDSTEIITFKQAKNGENMEMWQGKTQIPEDVESQRCTATFKAVDQNNTRNQYSFRWQLNQ